MKRLLSYLLVLGALASCGRGVQRQVSGVAGEWELPEGFEVGGDLPDSLAAFYDYSEGLKAVLISGDSIAARGWFERALVRDSLFAPACYQLAELLPPREALAYSRRAWELDSTNVDYSGQLGRTLVHSGKFEEAIPVYKRLLREDPGNPLNYGVLASIYANSGQPYTAIGVLDTAEYKLGRIEELSSTKLELLMATGMYDRALEETEALIADYPYNETSHIARGNIYMTMGKDSLALASYREALRIDSTNIVTLTALADYYQSQRDANNYFGTVQKVFESDDFPKEQKLAVFEKITSDINFYRANYFMINGLAGTLSLKYPSDFKVQALWGTHLIRSGEIEKALAMYKDFAASNPLQKEPYYAIIDIESYLQRPDSVARYSEMALERFPDDSELYMRKGFALSGMMQNGEAVAAYRSALKYARTDSVRSVVAGVLGDHYHQTGQTARTYSSYRQALRYDPDNELVLNNYAYYLSEEGRDLERALEMSRRANELNPGNPTSLDTYAWILYKMGRYEEAREPILQAVSLDTSGSDVIYLHYGDILYMLGEEFMAEIYWRKALEAGYDKQEIEKRYKLPEK